MSSALTAHWLVHALGWAILHSLWQGVAIAAIVAILLRALARSTANVRYVIACAGLAAMAASWAFTAANHMNPRSAAADVGGIATIIDPVDRSNPSITPQDAALLDEGGDAAPAGVSWRSRLDSWSAAIVLVWLLGVSLFSARLVLGWYQVHRLRTTTNQTVADEWLQRGRLLANRLEVSRPFRLAQSAAVQVPAVVGWLRPIILLPISAVSGLTRTQLDAIIAHELAHVRRHDYLVNIVQTAVEVLLFYHPACWWLSRQIRSEREHCCDDLVVTVCGDPVSYATALTELETLRGRSATLSLAATDGPLLRRVRRLLGSRSVVNESGPSWVIAAVPIVILTIALTSVNAAQSPTPTPARSVPPNEGVMQGQVVDAVSGRPLRSVSVEMIGPERAITVTTGEDGTYEASGLEPGKYRVSAKLTGYVTAHFGGRNRNDIGVLAEVGGGRFTSGIDLKMQAAGGVTGRVFDSRGEGVSGVEMELLSPTSRPGMPGPAGIEFAQTEDGGEFRFSQVPPGDYWVRAYMTPRERGTEPHALVARAMRDLANARDSMASGVRPGTAYRSTFFPGVSHIEEAQLLRVDAGGDLVGIDFALVAEPTHRVTGRVFDENGRPPGQVRIQMHSIAPNASAGEYSGSVDRNGRFQLTDVVAGNYMLMVQDPQNAWRWAAAVERISIDDEDVTGLELRARAGAHVQGRVLRDTGVTRALDPTGIRVQFQRVVSGSGLFLGGGRPTDADGTFSFETPAGPMTIAVPNVPSGWMVRRIVVDDAEIGDRPFELAEGIGHRVDVVLTDRITQLRGVVRDAKDRTVIGAEVLVFSEDAPKWTPGARSVRQVRADAFGRFQIDALPPGDYLAVAVDEPVPYALEEPDMVQRLSTSATRVRITDGERRALSLRVTRR